MKGKISGQSRAAKVRAAEDQGGKPPGGLRLRVLRPSVLRAKSALSLRDREREREREKEGVRGRERETFVLRTYILGGIGEKKLHTDE